MLGVNYVTDCVCMCKIMCKINLVALARIDKVPDGDDDDVP